MSLKDIEQEHVEQALDQVLKDGVPEKRNSKAYCLVRDGKHFPPKCIVSLAHEIATGEPLAWDEFSGGKQTNRPLRKLGFTVVECRCGGGLGEREEPYHRMEKATDTSKSTLRVAMVFPWLKLNPESNEPEPHVPTLNSFANERVDVVLFPEGYVRTSDKKRIGLLKRLARNLKAELLVGACHLDEEDRTWQVLLRIDSIGLGCEQIYTKHSTEDAIAFELPHWDRRERLPTFEVKGTRTGATICHDHYLGLLQRFLAKQGARLWMNPSFSNVQGIKWSSVLRLRAVENRSFALCTLHDDEEKVNSTHPFAFSPQGVELKARRAGCGNAEAIPLSQCIEAGKIYIVELRVDEAGRELDWSKIPHAEQPKTLGNGNPDKVKPLKLALLRGSKRVVRGTSRWEEIPISGGRIETACGTVYVGMLWEERILDPAERFKVIDQAKQIQSEIREETQDKKVRCWPVIWNHWKRLPTDSSRLASLMMGASIVCCAPIVISDNDRLHELVEHSNYEKDPKRRLPKRATVNGAKEEIWIADLRFARGLDAALKCVTHYPHDLRPLRRSSEVIETALDRYRSLAK